MKLFLLAALAVGTIAHAETIRGTHQEQNPQTYHEVEDWRIEISSGNITFWVRGSMVTAQEFGEKIQLKGNCPDLRFTPTWLNNMVPL